MPDQEPSQPVQEMFLAQLVRTKAPVTVFLTNGVKLQGRLTNFDRVCLVLTRAGHAQLIFKKAVSTVMPSGETEQQDALARPDVSARLSLARRRE
jgi:host factor-I protein